eukprot:TRINITY_DN856_c0_g1_i1.p1 TRINITY_DN856_c0_g1~~TRINITY_DN856_c0_g1_i1.p1  ORF type:complete len:390 (+),score=228.09 TRINITY_DN856_c0_g1_i1:73-1242(+)
MQDAVEEYDDLGDHTILRRYKAAGDVGSRVAAQLAAICVPGADIADLCAQGDRFILKELSEVYKERKDLEKGIAMPTAISVNNVVGNFSPPASLIGKSQKLKEGDLVKIELGVHIDGYASNIGFSTVATATPDQPITGRKADVICAAHFAGEAALHLLVNGKTNNEVTETITKIAQVFNCNLVEGVLSHQTKRFVCDGNNVIVSVPTSDLVAPEFSFEAGQVFTIDILMSTGSGKVKLSDEKPTIFKKVVDATYKPKVQASRTMLQDVNRKYPTFPFSLRSFDGEGKAKLGIIELLKHDVIQPFPIVLEKDNGEQVAQFKFTVLIREKVTEKLAVYNLPYVSSAISITDPALNAIIGSTIDTRTEEEIENDEEPEDGELEEEEEEEEEA